MLPSLFDRGAVPKTGRSELAIHLETFSYILKLWENCSGQAGISSMERGSTSFLPSRAARNWLDIA